MGSMRAYAFQDRPGLDSLGMTERPEPRPGHGEVLVAVRAVSLNYRDLTTALGSFTGGQVPLGVVPASDGCGEVVAVGPGVTRLSPGDRVVAAFMPGWIDGDLTAEKQATAMGAGTADGMLAERVVLPEPALVRLPPHLSFEEGATLPCAGVTAWYALFEGATVRPGTTVLLLGTGGVSVFSLQFAKLAGARVIITSSSDDKLERARALGADLTVNYREHPDWEQRVVALTDGRGADHAVEVGGPGTLNRTLKALRFGGSMSLMGVLTGLSDQVETALILRKNIRIQGTFVGSVAMLERMCRAIAASGMRPVIDRVFGFDQARDAYALMRSGGHFGKIVVRVS